MTANSGFHVYDLSPANTIVSGDLFLVVKSPLSNPTYEKVTSDTIANSFNNISNSSLTFLDANTPTNSTSLSISQGVIFYDSNYIYVSVANNVVKRAALSSF